MGGSKHEAEVFADEGRPFLDSESLNYGTLRPTTSNSSHHDHNFLDEPAARPDAYTEELSTRQLLAISGSTYLGILLAALDGTMVATLTASISGSFDSLRLLAWLASAYYIANSVLQPLSGKLTDIYGRRTGLVFCNILFCAGNLICGLAQSESTIIAGRVVAGLGGGGLNAIPLFITNDLVPLRRRGVWQGFNNICFGVGSGLGGVFGGWINDTIGWRAAFLILVPLTILSCLLVTFFVKLPTKDIDEDIDDKWQRVDVKGSLFLTTAIILLLFGLNSGGNTLPWLHPLVLASLILSGLLFVCFGYIEAYHALEPIIPIRLLLNQTVLSACLTSWFFSMAQLALTFYSPLFFQLQRRTAQQAGLLLIPTSVGAAVGGVLTGIIIRATGRYYLLNLVIQLLFLLPLGIATTFDLSTPVAWPIVCFFSTGLAYAGKLTVTVTALIAAVEHRHHAVVTSASYACRATGSSIGIAVCSLVFQNVLHNQLSANFSTDRTGVGKHGKENLTTPEAESIIRRLRDNLSEIWRLPNEDWVIRAEDAYVRSLRAVFWTIFALGAAGTVASLFLREGKLHRSIARRD